MDVEQSRAEARRRYAEETAAAAELLRTEFPDLHAQCVTEARRYAGTRLTMPTAAEPTPGEPSTEPDPAQVATWLELLAGQLARPRLVRNRARCRGCEQEIESTSRHDFVTCRCGRTSVDGGLDYAKRGWDGAGPGFEELAEYESVDDIRGRLRRHTTPPPH